MSEWRDIKHETRDGVPVFLGWEGTGFQAAVGHREDGMWGYLTGDMGFVQYLQKPTHYMPMIYSPPLPDPPAEGDTG